MQCPYCGSEDSRVMDSRMVDGAIRRRRACSRCSSRFTTYERVQPAGILVLKKDGRREEFSRDKLLSGVRKACEKRPLQAEAITSLVEEVEAAVLVLGQSDVKSSYIGELVMSALQDLDQIAYVRFACVYRDFADIDSLREALDALQQGGGHNAQPREQLSLLPEEELNHLIEPSRILPLRLAADRRLGRSRRVRGG